MIVNVTKRALLLIVMIATTRNTLGAQADTFLLQQFYFEDNAGNQDTVTVYYAWKDSLITTPTSRPSPANLAGTPFDSTFEVRAIQFDDLIGCDNRVDTADCFSGNSIIPTTLLTRDSNVVRGYREIVFLVHTIHPPLNISWDPLPDLNRFRDLVNSSVLVNAPPLSEATFETVLPQPGALDYTCINSDSTKTFIELDSTFDRFPKGSVSIWTVERAISGSNDSIGSINAFYFKFLGKPDSPCDFLGTVSNQNRPAAPLRFYPNPVRQVLNFELPADYDARPARVEVFSATGRLVSSRPQAKLSGSLDVRGLVPGWYFLRLILEDETAISRRFVISR